MFASDQIEAKNAGRLRKLAGSINTTILFAGAGLSVPAYPLWHPFLHGHLDQAVRHGLMPIEERDALKQILGNDLPKLTSYLQESLDHRLNFLEAIDDVFIRTVKPPTDLHRAVVQIPFRAIVTTNFDSGLMDAASTNSARIVDPYDGGSEQNLSVWIEGRAFRQPERFPIMSLHGDRKTPGEIVFSEDEFVLKYESARSDRVLQLIDVILGGNVLFAGFSFSDPWLTRLLRLKSYRATRTEKIDTNRMTIVGIEVPTKDKVKVVEFLYSKLGLEPIIYEIHPEDRAHGEPDRELLWIFDQLRNLSHSPVAAPTGFLGIKSSDLVLEVHGHRLPFVIVGPGSLADNGIGRPVNIDYSFAMGASPIPASLAARLLKRPHPSNGAAPARLLSRDDAVAIAQAISSVTGRRLRLPTEAEWELAARLALRDQREFDAADASALPEVPAEAMARGPSGLQRMFGVVWEWVADTGDGDRRILPLDGSAQRITANQGIQKGGKASGHSRDAIALDRRIRRPDKSDELCGVRLVLEV